MDVNIANCFLSAVQNIMPQIGLPEPVKESVGLTKGEVKSKGLLVNIGLIGSISGNVAYNFDADTAKLIASTMMGGMEVKEIDELAKSAISEMGNMFAANASMQIEKLGKQIDISPPAVMIGDGVSVRSVVDSFITVVVKFGDAKLEIDLAYVDK